MKIHSVNGEIILHGAVGESFWDDSGLTAVDLIAELAGVSGDITVRINSGGGDAFEGSAIHAALAGHDGAVTVLVEGIAGSAASLIAMAGDEIVMTEGSIMMIHDPSTIAWGDAAGLRREADVLDKLANEYAGVYARRSGVPKKDMRELMKAELWMGGEDAVSQGFADKTTVSEDDDSDPVMVAPFPYEMYEGAPVHVMSLDRLNGWSAGGPRPNRATVLAVTKEASMPAKKPTAADTPAPNDTPKVEAEVKEPPKTEKATMSVDPAVKASLDAQDRRSQVLMIAGDSLTARQVEEIVSETDCPASAKMKAADMVCEMRMKEEPAPTRPTAQIISDEQERDSEAMIGALGATMFGGKLEGPAQKFPGMSLRRLAMHLGGGDRMGTSTQDIVKAGMSASGVMMASGSQSTSDFTYITANTMNRALRAAYEARPGTWRQISRARTAVDFRPLYSVQSGMNTELEKVNEAGEYVTSTIVDAGETFQVERAGKMVVITFEAVINDDMGAFARIPTDFARGALNRESKIIWGLINANGNMSDGTAFFANSAARGNNLAASGGAISVTSVGNGRKVMFEQRPLGAAADGADFISAEPDLMFVPPALETAAAKFASAITPRNMDDTNPWRQTISPVVETRLGGKVSGGSDSAWYLFDSSLPPVEHAFLEGFDGPMIMPEEKYNPRGVTVMAEHIFGAGLVEFRGAYKNAGS